MCCYGELSQVWGFLCFGSTGGGALPVTFAIHFYDRRVMNKAVHNPEPRRASCAITDEVRVLSNVAYKKPQTLS